MLKGDSKKDGKKSIGLISKNKTTLRHGTHSFVHFFAMIVLHDYNVTLPVTCFMDEMSYVLLSVFFFTAAYFVTSSSCSSTSFSIVICVDRLMFSSIFCE